MIVCHCHGVTDREIRACVQDGARSCAELAETCGAGSGCGGCSALVTEIVQDHRRRLAMVKGEIAASSLAALSPANGYDSSLAY
jgi:bacterioferritin-associated ferredoxin